MGVFSYNHIRALITVHFHTRIFTKEWFLTIWLIFNDFYIKQHNKTNLNKISHKSIIIHKSYIRTTFKQMWFIIKSLLLTFTKSASNCFLYKNSHGTKFKLEKNIIKKPDLLDMITSCLFRQIQYLYQQIIHINEWQPLELGIRAYNAIDNR